ncbi:dynein light chain LC6, flagellar outer arm-like [Dermacentor albipictus]|uniref:dynein light chain LC6, flagellar outer arm-like n=1 Tax=Dermacentor albipictus TaxID=60249 RepID=UPI0038FC6E71
MAAATANAPPPAGMDTKDPAMDVEVHYGDLPQDMINELRDVASKAMKDSKDWADIATTIKTAFETKYGPTWFCVVGKDFGITGTCEMNRGGFVSIAGVAVGVFKFK